VRATYFLFWRKYGAEAEPAFGGTLSVSASRITRAAYLLAAFTAWIGFANKWAYAAGNVPPIPEKCPTATPTHCDAAAVINEASTFLASLIDKAYAHDSRDLQKIHEKERSHSGLDLLRYRQDLLSGMNITP
jgi:hypothetical protein